MSKRPRKLLDQAREAIRQKHYSISVERDGNQYTQYDAQPEEQKREALSASRSAFWPPFQPGPNWT